MLDHGALCMGLQDHASLPSSLDSSGYSILGQLIVILILTLVGY